MWHFRLYSHIGCPSIYLWNTKLFCSIDCWKSLCLCSGLIECETCNCYTRMIMTLSLCASEFETKEDAEEMQTLPGEFFNKATHKVSPQF